MTDEQVAKRVEQLTRIDQQLTSLLQQKQHQQSQHNELIHALEELEKTTQAYRIVGSIMVASNKDSLKTDLTEKKELVELRINAIEKQEKNLREQAEKLREAVFK